MDKIIKLNSRQGGPFNQQQNLCDFDLPGDGTYNLADSYINLYARVTGTTGASTITNMGTNDQRVATLANLAVNWKDSPARSFYNIAMVKNCALSSEQAGVLEDIRRVDILKQNLNEYAMSTDEKASLNYTRLSGRTDQSGERSSIFNLLFKEGSQTSQIIPGRIQIPLAQLFELGKMKEYPAMNLGKSRIHLEMNLDKFQVVDATDSGRRQTLHNFADVDNASGGAALDCTWVSKAPLTRKEDSCFYVGQRVDLKYTSDDALAADAAALAASATVADGADFTLIAAAQQGEAARTVTITSTDDVSGATFTVSGYTTLSGALTTDTIGTLNAATKSTTKTFYKVTAIAVAGAAGTACSAGWGAVAAPTYYKEKIIASISYGTVAANVNSGDMKQILTFDTNAPQVPTTKTYSAVTITPSVTQTAGTMVVESAELVLRKLNKNVKAPSELNYLTWSTEQFTANNEKDFQRMFQLEPEAVNVFATFPDHDLFSRNGDLKSFRLRLDGEDLVDRDISVGEEKARDPLYYDRLSMTMLNSMIPLNSLSEQNESVGGYDPYINSRPNGDEIIYHSVSAAGDGDLVLNVNLDGRKLYLHLAETDDAKTYQIYGQLQDGTAESSETITTSGGQKLYTSAKRYKSIQKLSVGSTPTKGITLYAKPYKLVTISSPVPQTPMEKLLQVNMDLSATTANSNPAGLKQMNLYKLVIRQVKP